jgi:hypothetical protein
MRIHATIVAALVLGDLLAGPGSAWAGGDFVDLAVGGGRVWLASGDGVRSFDARTGRTLSMPRLAGPAPYALSVAIGGGARWVASVENGYVWGTLSRIDRRTGVVRVVWRRPNSSVQYVAIGAGSVWALIGGRRGARILRFSPSGRLQRSWTIPGAGRIAADAAGCWVSTARWLLRIDPAGTLHRVLRAPLADVATGGGAAWLGRTTSILRIDESSGRVRTLAVGRLRSGGFQHDLATTGGVLWALRQPSAGPHRSILTRIDPRTGRTTGRVVFPGIADAVVAEPDAVWVASNVPAAGGSGVDAEITRLDPRTLSRTLVVRIP